MSEIISNICCRINEIIVGVAEKIVVQPEIQGVLFVSRCTLLISQVRVFKTFNLASDFLICLEIKDNLEHIESPFCASLKASDA